MDSDTLSELSAPFRSLCAALILSAYRDAWKPVLIGWDFSHRQHIIDRERSWFASTSQAPWSFEWLCQQLDLDPRIIRRQALSGWKKFKLAQTQTNKRKEESYE